MADQKNPKEASNIFHSIMKASVKPIKSSSTKCPICGADADQIPPPKREGLILIVKCKCVNGHEFFISIPTQ